MIGVLHTSKKLFHLKGSCDNLKPIVSHADEILLVKWTLAFLYHNASPFFRYKTPVPIRSHTQSFIALKYGKKLHKLIKRLPWYKRLSRMIKELNKLVNRTRNVLITQVERSWNEACHLTQSVSSRKECEQQHITLPNRYFVSVWGLLTYKACIKRL